MTDEWLGDLPLNLRVGTSSFSHKDWSGSFYPEDLAAAERLGWYARHFPAVEVDATFYRMPSRGMVGNWARRTPESFALAMKVPQDITHDAQLEGTDAAVAELLDVTRQLGPRRGPLLLQFPYVAKGRDAAEYEYGDGFLRRLEPWLGRWSGEADWVVEVRNSTWLREPLLALLRGHRVPLALTAYYTMPPLSRLQALGLDVLTGGFAYVRFLGHRKQIDELLDHRLRTGRKTRRFDELVVDREAELRDWVDALLPVVSRMPTWAFFNNHYAGFGPGSARMFAQLWREIHDVE